MKQMSLIPFEVQSMVKNTYEIPFGVKMIGAPEFWEESDKGRGIVIAVLDSGCDINHPDLKERIIGGADFTSDSHQDLTDIKNLKNVTDILGHGTHVAGTIAATINGSGVVGVAPEAKLLICKVLKRVEDVGPGDSKFRADYPNIVKAINECVKWRGPNQERVRIISMSLSGKEEDLELHNSIKKAVLNDILVICAAGNKGDGNEHTKEVGYPAYYPEVVCVGAVNMYKKLSQFTNTHDEVDLVAPGEEILSTFTNDKGYATLRGTSMATPHVAGAAALLLKHHEKKFHKKLTEPELFTELIKHTKSIGYSKYGEGHGLLILNIKDNV
ncbi:MULTISPECIES: S8 family peptidase [Bacillus]|nr:MULTISPECIES: S8 family peptidase [Bacillus cereus group]EOP29569.1 hypothetical protein IIS_05247 [Bacillus cereus VD131]MBJ8043949.1 S8 family peptidase [Bacillus cereus group sp. N17]MCU5728801.1 S8 family peptidase [Bacillus toyonensis]MDD9264288.1 S8 family peptidase [Bacillus toyonensis]TBX55737.1 serine protease [Bacillus toyonensis]